MEINKSVILYANVKIGEEVVANLTANISVKGYNVGVNYINKGLIDSTEENQLAYDEQYNLFVTTVNEQLV